MAAVLRTEIELSYTGQEAILWFSGLPAQLGSLQAALKLAGSATLHLVCVCASPACRTHATSQSQLTRQLQDSCSGHPQLTLVNEAPFSDMFEDAKGQTK